MALLKNFKYANGTETNYHKISEIKIQPRKRTVINWIDNPEKEDEQIPVENIVQSYYLSIIVHSYVSQDIRDTGDNNYLRTKMYTFEMNEETMQSASIMTVCYNLLKADPEFEGAEDI